MPDTLRFAPHSWRRDAVTEAADLRAIKVKEALLPTVRQILEPSLCAVTLH